MTRTPRSTSAPRAVRAATLVAASLALAACAGPSEGEFVHDPWEDTNRQIHEFNKGVDTVLLRPAGQAYDAAVPGLAKLLIGNALDMLDMPMIVINRVLQGEPMLALEAVGRTGLNVVFGGGLLDPATEFGLPKEETDLGLTFASWGVEEGPYVELPFLGPATSRDAVGRVAEIAVDPFNFLTGVPAVDALGPGAAVTGIVEIRAENMSAIDRVLYESEDSYVAVRTFYNQRRRREAAGGVTADSLPDVYGED